MRARLRGTEIYFDVDGVGLAPDRDGMTAKPVVFLLPGGPGGDHVWYKTSCGSLTDVAQLVYVDHRGAGRSATGDPATYTLDNNIDDLEALRQHLGLDRITILGASYGGMVAQGYAIRYPDTLANLILVVTAASYRFLEDAKRELQARGTPEQIRVCERLWSGTFENLDQLKEYYRIMGPLYSRTWKEEGFDAGWNRSQRSYIALNRGFSDFLRTFDYTEQLSQIRCPTLVMGGAHDWICPIAHSRLIAERIPRAHLKVFAHSSHSIPSDEPEAYLQAVRGFLTCAAT